MAQVMTTDGFMAALAASSRRYEKRTDEREETRQVLDERGVLYADQPARLQKRLDRLGVDWTLAKAVEQTPAGVSTGRSLDESLPPGDFGAEVLGLERLMGRNDLVDVGFLERGHLASRSVGRISVSAPGAHYGSGFMVSPRLLLTNNHVLSEPEETARGCVEFNFQAGLDGRALPPVAFRLEPDVFFATNKDLDFTLVAVAEKEESGAKLSDFGWLRLIEAQGKIVLGEYVNVIQHPNGEPKQLALRENRVVDRLERFLHYETDTAPGSSGSPVFNDQWEVVALHHSGVPQKDAAGNYLALDGSRWTREMGEQRLAWKANEGVRISRVLKALREEPLSGRADELRAQVYEPGPAIEAQPSAQTHPPAAISLAAPGIESGSSVFTVPLRVSVTLRTEVEAPVSESPGSEAPEEDPELRAALVDLAAASGRPYYDAGADEAARERYYADVDADGPGLYSALSELLERSHQPRPAYRPMRLLYPWVDLHPDGLLRSIYSTKPFTPEELIRADAAVEAARTRLLEEFIRRQAAVGPRELEAELEAIEAALPFNCEHVVPQSWFAKKEPMRGDLHHLFACESGCNSFRGNFPYFDFEDEEAHRHDCGRREAAGFEPADGHGPVARATLYFLLRYPGLVGDAKPELTEERLPLLLAWHRNDPVAEYERHRNAAIAELQGNRNPLIDHPDWDARIDFSPAWDRFDFAFRADVGSPQERRRKENRMTTTVEYLPPIEGPLVDWKGDEQATTEVTEEALAANESKSFGEAIETQEKLIGENNLRPIAFLETGVARSRAVARITIPGSGVATGFMIGADRLLTNNHVFGSAGEAEGATIQFNFQTDLAGDPLDTDDYTADPDTFFHTNGDLDYSVVHVSGTPGDKWGWIELRDDLSVSAKQDVAIIQHPGGQPKQIAIADNEIEFADETVAQYLTDTMPGSSGSPVFNNDWECVALHHSGGWLPQPGDGSTHFRNEGILISAILADMPS